MNTFRDQFGRRDPDLSPAHDALICWLDEQLRQGKLGLASDVRSGMVPIRIEWESIVPATERGRLPVAFIDILATFEIEAGRQFRIGFEIKPQIYSIGELLRQLKTYKNLDPDVDRWVVVSTANELAEKAVRREGFGWLTVPPEVLP